LARPPTINLIVEQARAIETVGVDETSAKEA
jgi:hypothetical protein